jgi:Ni/Co efflux regulator RcnB
MKRICSVFILAALSVGLSAGASFAEEHHDGHAYVRHDEWKKGANINHDDWNRGEKIDYRQHHLNAPPRGYEWREVDGNYVLAAVATGLISSVIIASAEH